MKGCLFGVSIKEKIFRDLNDSGGFCVKKRAVAQQKVIINFCYCDSPFLSGSSDCCGSGICRLRSLLLCLQLQSKSMERISLIYSCLRASAAL